MESDWNVFFTFLLNFSLDIKLSCNWYRIVFLNDYSFLIIIDYFLFFTIISWQHTQLSFLSVLFYSRFESFDDDDAPVSKIAIKSKQNGKTKKVSYFPFSLICSFITFDELLILFELFYLTFDPEKY